MSDTQLAFLRQSDDSLLEATIMAAKPRVLVLGGAGMIGRNFVKYLIDRDLVAAVRVADKTMPEISYFRYRGHMRVFLAMRT